MEYFLGIDIGTTSVKTIAFSRDGKLISEQSGSYPIRHPFPGWSEQDPDEICSAVFLTLENILLELSPYLPVLCSFSAAMHSLIAVNTEGIAISPSIIWADNRAARFAEQILSEKKAPEIYNRTGLPVHAMSPFFKLQWMKENQKDIFDRAHKFVGIKEYLFYKLFAGWWVDVSMAGATGLMNLHTLQWDPWLLELAGISVERLSQIVETDRTFYNQQIFQNLRDIPFIIGGSDGAMANLGATDEPGALVVTVGTSSAARLILHAPVTDAAMRNFCYYIRKGEWLLGGASNNGGIVLQWIQKDIFKSKEKLDDFLIQAASVKAGSDGLIFLPYLLGERAPVWDAYARGVMFGLQIQHGQAEMVRATLEGVVYCLYGISQPLFEQADIHKIVATGGFARNELWLQILSDVFNLPVEVCETVENSAWGAAKCGMQAMGIAVKEITTVSRSYFPDTRAHLVYQKGFQQFQRLYDLLKGEFN